jgi:hypothetical protein
MRGAATKPQKARGENINIRVSRGQKSLFDRAAQALGRNRSDLCWRPHAAKPKASDPKQKYLWMAVTRRVFRLHARAENTEKTVSHRESGNKMFL